MNARHEDQLHSGIPPLALYTYTAATGIDPKLMQAALRRGQRERADAAATLGRAIARGVTATLRAIGRTARVTADGLARAQRRRAAHAILLQMDRHLLDDIGLRPEQLRGVVENLLSAPEPGAAPRVVTTPRAPAAHTPPPRLAA